VRALRDLGVDARGLARSGVITSNDFVETFPPRPKGLPGLWTPADRYWRTLRLIAWADVVHWHYGWALHDALDVRFARMLDKKMCVEFWGSDIRIDALEAADNPLYAEVAAADRGRDASAKRSHEIQATLARLGAKFILPCPSLIPHLAPTQAKSYFCTRQRVYLEDFAPRFPDPQRATPVILHAPSSQLVKGTAHVQSAIEELRRRGLQFEYRLIENMPHAQALELMADCDMYVDQLIIGSHGLAALEAMALGKPVVCYIKPSMRAKYPPELPIVSASPHDLADVLAGLLADRARLTDLGRQGRDYVERYHDSHRLAAELVEFYKSL